MLLPSFHADQASCPGNLHFEQEHDMPNGYFGDRDAGHRPAGRPRPPATGLFGRLGDDPPLVPANDSPHRRPRPADEADTGRA